MRPSPLLLAWLIAFNLRAGLLAVSPVLPALQADLHLLHAESQTIFALPVIVMGLLSIPGGLLADRFGTRRAILAGLALALAAQVLRAASRSYWTLALLTVGFGAGIGVVQPALPKLVRERYPDRTQTATGVYTSGFAAGGALGGWLTAAYLQRWTGGWRGTFLVWGLFVAVPLVLWALFADRGAVWGRAAAARARRSGSVVAARPAVPTAAHRGAADGRTPAGPRGRPVGGGSTPPWRLPGIGVTAAIGVTQAVSFYTVTAWLPTYLHELGAGPARVSLVFGLYQVLTIPATILAPWLMHRLGRRRVFMTACAVLYLVGVAGFAASPAQSLLWALLAGTCNAPAFVMSLALPAELAPREQVARATGVVLTASYSGAVFGPPIAGLLRDATGVPASGFAPALVALAGLVAVSLFVPEPPGSRRPAPAS